MSQQPFDGTQQTWSVIGNALANVARGVDGGVKTYQDLQETEQRRQALLLQQKQTQQQMDIQKGTYDRGILGQSAEHAQQQGQYDLTHGRTQDAYASGQRLLEDNNKLYGENNVGPKLEPVAATGPVSWLNKDMTPAPAGAPAPTDWQNPFNAQAVGRMLQYSPPAPKVIEASAPLVSVTTDPVTGKQTAHEMWKPEPKPVKFDYSRYHVDFASGKLLDLGSGKVIQFTTPSASADVKQQQLDLAIKRLQFDFDKGNAGLGSSYERDVAEAGAHARDAAIQAGGTPAEVEAAFNAAVTAYKASRPAPQQINPLAPGAPGTPGTLSVDGIDAMVKRYPGAQVTSGTRTLAEQASLYDQYKNHGGNLAAPPTPNAPHVAGRARDVYVPAAQQAAFIKEAQDAGYKVLTVYKDHVHIEVPEGPPPRQRPMTPAPNATPGPHGRVVSQAAHDLLKDY